MTALASGDPSDSLVSSLWEATATDRLLLPALRYERQPYDVLLVGAGYTGLSSALHLARAGARVCVLEARQPGWGASGRNGGQVNPSLRHDPDQLVALLKDRAEPLIHAIGGSADLVFELIERYDIDCQPVRQGWLQVSYNEAQVPLLHRRAQQWGARGYPVQMLDRQQLLQYTGTDLFRGGWLDQRAGSLQPLSYVRGLARAAQAEGAVIFGDSAVVRLQRDGAYWCADTATGGRVRASQVVLATNAYSDGLWPGLSRTFLAANSFIVATRPMPQAAAHILPDGQTLSTAQRLMVYLRKDPSGRVLLGGRGHFADPVRSEDFAHIEKALITLYPELVPLDVEYRWAGRVAITPDALPHVHCPAPGVTIALGYNGRGIAAATVMGRHIAALLIRHSSQDFPFPITSLSPVPLHGLQRFYISAAVAWYALLDRLQ